MRKGKQSSIFNTSKRIRLGLWGLGRGMSFYHMCDALQFDVVAGCDYNEHMRARFREANPHAFVTDNADAFLAADFDAVLLATFCPAHADDAIACLHAGKHVLSEVTSFHTMAEGVRLVEAAEQSDRVYNLAENYPFSAANMYVARKWREGLFGELMYAEGEYVHDVRSYAYTYIDGVPILPGYTLHNWRSWLHFHYYCTHSLGPIMHITGARPVRVVSLPGRHSLPGAPMPAVQGLVGIAPSLISMDNGAVVRNLMGGTTNDVHTFRYWGTRGSAEVSDRLFLRLGGAGQSPKFEINADWGALAEIARTAGHGGGDCWVLYYFARQILEGTPAPFDVYTAADVTIPGILAYRSSINGGQSYDVPDFRKKKERDRFRHDNEAQARFNPKTVCFPKHADKTRTGRFTALMTGLLRYTAQYRAYADWMQVADGVAEPGRLVELADTVIENHAAMSAALREAQTLANDYPRSEGARLLREMLDTADAGTVLSPGFVAGVKKVRARLRRM